MSWSETVATAWSAIRAHGLRSLLTVLGMLIGIAAVILTVGLGLGTQKDVSAQISSLGSNLLIVTPGSTTSTSGTRGGFGSATTLTQSDAEALGNATAAPDIEAVAPEKSSSVEIDAGSDSNWTTTAYGVTSDWLSVRSRAVQYGSFLSEDATDEMVLGATAATELFGYENVVGQSVTISSNEFRVVGVLASAGASSDDDLDDLALVPMQVMADQIVGGTTRSAVSTIYIKAARADQISAASQEANSLLLNLHGITSADEADFTINSQDSLVSAATSVYRTLTVLLAGVAGLSLLVGGVGVMNIMLVSVTERTREIGLRKALGAPPAAIRRQFLVEASILGLGGGAIGAALGVLGGVLVPRLTSSSIVIQPAVVVGSIAISVGIGLVFGVYPAVRAAKLAPIDALRSD